MSGNAASLYRAVVQPFPHTTPQLFEARCSCGWESKYLMSDPEAAEYAAHLHTLGRTDHATVV